MTGLPLLKPLPTLQYWLLNRLSALAMVTENEKDQLKLELTPKHSDKLVSNALIG
jgi:hypothetical protein